jgi:ribosomal protein S27AE
MKNSVEYDREYRKKHPEKMLEKALKWAHKNPDKKRAHGNLYYGLKTGKVVKQTCEVCQETKVDAHHDDYSKPLEVRWLCRKHHAQV